MENNTQENLNNNANINDTKVEKKGLPIYIVPVLIVLTICIVGGMFISKLDFSKTGETGTPSDDVIVSTKQDDDINQNENPIVTPNDEITNEDSTLPSEPETEDSTILENDTNTNKPPVTEEVPNDENLNTESNTGTQSE